MSSLLTKELRVVVGSRVWMPPVWALLLALAGVIFFCRLGLWQLDRAEQKAVMISRYEARSREAPLTSVAGLSASTGLEDRRVSLDGRWDNSRLVYLENQMRGPEAGFHVHTVFYPASGGPGILVNRGWIPVGKDIQSLPGVTAAKSGHVEGMLAYPSAYFTVGEPDYRQRPLHVARLDLARLSKALGVELQPFVIRLDSTSPDGFIREWQPAARLAMPPEKHRAYAFQWFSLAITVLVVLLVVNLRKSGGSENE